MSVPVPLVSIVIPVFNGSSYLQEAIESALDQTYPNIEVIVVNDGSSDGGATERIALSFGSRIRYFSKENGGVASALNAGIRLMSGEYFSWLSHDDVYYQCKISDQIACLQQLGRQVMLYSDYDVINSSSRIIRTVSIRQYAPHEIRRALILDYPIHGCSALVPKNCFDRVGLFNERLRTTQDCDMWFRIASDYDVVHMPASLIKSREHPEQGTFTMNSLHFRECNEFLADGMLKVEQELRAQHLIDICTTFLGECLTSFTRRGFHRASRIAFKHYSKMLLRNGSITGTASVMPFLDFTAGNIFRFGNVFRLRACKLRKL